MDSTGVVHNVGKVDALTELGESVTYSNEGCLASIILTGEEKIDSLMLYERRPTELFTKLDCSTSQILLLTQRNEFDVPETGSTSHVIVSGSEQIIEGPREGCIQSFSLTDEAGQPIYSTDIFQISKQG